MAFRQLPPTLILDTQWDLLNALTAQERLRRPGANVSRAEILRAALDAGLPVVEQRLARGESLEGPPSPPTGRPRQGSGR